MSKLALDRFLALVERCGLVDAERLSEVVLAWKIQASASQLDDSQQCGAHLVRLGLLTPWQCHKLLEGRHRGFFLGNYKLLDHLGSGGMSNVYLAEHVLMQRLVAVKVLPENRVADSAYLDRFHLEGQAVAALDHPNIVRAYDLGSEGRIHYLVMEYVDGDDLAALVERIGPLDYYTAAHYVAQAAAGLEHAHRSGLVHRDVKPANLLVDRRGTVKVLDLGLAKFDAGVRPAPAFAQQEQVLGTAEYFAPEQAVNSQAVDHRADIYGLGCTLYFLLTGHPPFAGRSASELMAAHQQHIASSVLVDRPDAPLTLVAICQRMMEKSRERRYQSMSEVVEALERWLDQEQTAGRLSPVQPGRMLPSDDVRSATQDTVPNLRKTDRLLASDVAAAPPSSDVFAPSGAKKPAGISPSQSHVLAVPPPPPSPPVVPPPREARAVPARTVGEASEARRAPAPPTVPAAPGRPISSAPYEAQPRGHKRAGAWRWTWALVLSAMVLGTLLLALFAMSA
jgi:serine/threonine-protein kinase